MTKTIVITGASKGLGKYLVSEFLKLDYKVYGVSRSGNFNHEGIFNYFDCKADVTNFKDLNEVFAKAISEQKTVDGVVHAAGVYGPFGKVTEISLVDWNAALEINLKGTLNSLVIAARIFEKQGYGNFIGLSGGGATSPMPRITAYAASKTAVVRLIESVAIEYFHSSITFNSVAPGLMDTQMLDQVLDAGPEMVGRDFFEKMKNAKESGSDSKEKAFELITFLINQSDSLVTGRLLSAVWDDWKACSMIRII